MDKYAFVLQNQINKLYEAIRSNNIMYLNNSIEEADRKYFLNRIVMMEFLAANNGVMPTTNRTPQYDDYVALANRYIDILKDELQPNKAYWSANAINELYNKATPFKQSDVLCKKDGNILTVANVLKVIGYTKKIINISGAKLDKNLSAGADLALMALDTIYFALNNQKQDRPLNQALHIANDALSLALSSAVEDERLGKYVEVSSLTIDLTIDFLVKE